MTSSFRCLPAIAILLSFFASAPAHSANWLEKLIYLSGPNYDGELPPCEAALGKIASRFAETESRFWYSVLQIVGFDKVREIAYSPWALGTIPRRFCSAKATVNDGRRRAVYYSIGEDTGIIGATWGVQWCVVGYDHNLAYAPNCRAARP